MHDCCGGDGEHEPFCDVGLAQRERECAERTAALDAEATALKARLADAKERVRRSVLLECRRLGLSEPQERVLMGAVARGFEPPPPGPPDPPVPPRDKPVS